MEEKTNLLEKLQSSNLLDFYLISLISSDTLLSVEDCERSLSKIQEVKELLITANVDNKEKYADMIDKGEEIIKRDLEMFKERNNI